jgi:hypothetical protein
MNIFVKHEIGKNCLQCTYCGAYDGGDASYCILFNETRNETGRLKKCIAASKCCVNCVEYLLYDKSVVCGEEQTDHMFKDFGTKCKKYREKGKQK